MSAERIEHAHARSMAIRHACYHGSPRQRELAASLRSRGMNAARDRNPRMLLFLEKAVEHMRRLNDEQQSRLTQEGYQRTKFTEFSTWEAAFLKSDQLGQDESLQFGVFAWVYAAIYESTLA
jgi:hypothetical protein